MSLHCFVSEDGHYCPVSNRVNDDKKTSSWIKQVLLRKSSSLTFSSRIPCFSDQMVELDKLSEMPSRPEIDRGKEPVSGYQSTNVIV